jgi:hypothetical protein
MKRLLLTLSSLSLVAVACGGISQHTVTDGSGGGGNDTTTGSGGGQSDPGNMSAGPGMPTMPGGPIAGTGGAAYGGAKALGGAPGYPGKAYGGTFSVGGGYPVQGGAPPDGEAECSDYCYTYAKICPQLGFEDPIGCTVECTDDLALSQGNCINGKRIAYACIAAAMRQAAGDCGAALENATELCGSATPDVPACNDDCLPSVFGDGTGCHASAECAGTVVDLHCLETNGANVPCTCSIGGQPTWKTATNFEYSKLACVDDALFRLCAKELP